jgi:hypothetical protein
MLCDITSRTNEGLVLKAPDHVVRGHFGQDQLSAAPLTTHRSNAIECPSVGGNKDVGPFGAALCCAVDKSVGAVGTVLAFKTYSCSPSLCAATCSSCEWDSLSSGLFGLTTRPIVAVCSISSRFGPTSAVKLVTPVRLPPGRARLGTSPTATGSPPAKNTIGIVVVAAFAASAAGVLLPQQSLSRDDQPVEDRRRRTLGRHRPQRHAMHGSPAPRDASPKDPGGGTYTSCQQRT